MLVGELVERVVQWASHSPPAPASNPPSGPPPGDVRLAEARSRFEQRTAPIEIDRPDYESRIAHFLEEYICSGCDTPGAPPVVDYAESHSDLLPQERLLLAGLLRSHRSLYRVRRAASAVTLDDLLLGARFDVHPNAGADVLSDGDIFDGRVVASARGVEVTPGRVFHPADSHAPLLTLLEQTRQQQFDPTRLLDALLGMRDRLHRFTRVRPEHLYRVEAIGSQAFSATWTHSTPPEASGAE